MPYLLLIASNGIETIESRGIDFVGYRLLIASNGIETVPLRVRQARGGCF